MWLGDFPMIKSAGEMLLRCRIVHTIPAAGRPLHKLRRMGGKVNEKKVAAQAVKDVDKARKTEAAIAADWADPTLAKKAAAANSAAVKADEAARKKREKEALLAAEDAALGSGGKIKSKFGAATTKKGGSKKKDDFSLLEDALIGDAEKKAKEKKRLERLKKEREAMASIEAERKAKEEQANKDPLLANTEAMLGLIPDGDDTGFDGPSLASRNVATMSDCHGTGVDAALSAMSLGGGKTAEHPEKRMKAAYKAYEEKMMPEMKILFPGLKRQQYLDKIFTSWKKSPENPMNQNQSK